MPPDWRVCPVAPLPPPPPAGGDVGFSAICRVVVRDRTGIASVGSGFVVHPRAVLTAAHVVAPWSWDGAHLPAASVVDLILRAQAPQLIAVPNPWLAARRRDADLAVLWFAEELCGSEQPLAVQPLADGAGAVAQAWGAPGGAPWFVVLNARRRGAFVDGTPSGPPVPPGFSGGPWFSPASREAIGVESFGDGSRETAVSPPIQELNKILRFLGA